MSLNSRYKIAAPLGVALLLAGAISSPASANSLVLGEMRNLDFETDASGNALTAGDSTAIGNQWSDWGLEISGTSNRRNVDGTLLLYDTSVRGEDPDLQTGPTIGSNPEGNALIIQEEKAGNDLSRPDDEAQGGAVHFNFGTNNSYAGVQLGNIRLLDIGDGAPNFGDVIFQGFSETGTLFSQSAQQLSMGGFANQVFGGTNGDNSIWDFDLGGFQASVSSTSANPLTKLLVQYDGSAAIAQLKWSELNSATDVPEPASTLGVLAAGLCVAAKKFRNRSTDAA